MSLDVWLSGEPAEVDCECPKCGNSHKSTDTAEFFSANITHNLNTMADHAGIYRHLWRPDELGISKARELIEPLAAGLDLLESDPERFKQFDPPNKWGDYDGLVGFVREYLAACRQYPESNVRASR